MLIPPPVLALCAAVAQRALTSDAQRPTAVRAAAAGAIAAASVTLAGAAGRQFRRAGTTFEPFDPGRASVLVTTGANSITRNPMYVGMTGLLVSHAVLRGGWAAFVPAAAFVLVVDRVQVAAEEAALLANFGPDYDAYRDMVPRWVGPRSTGWRRGTTGEAADNP